MDKELQVFDFEGKSGSIALKRDSSVSSKGF
jgi:hypothetical protein